jgi:hypothetical protein
MTVNQFTLDGQYSNFYAYRYNVTTGQLINTYYNGQTSYSYSYLLVANGYLFTGSNRYIFYFNATTSAFIGTIDKSYILTDIKYISVVDKFVYVYF